MPASSPQPFRFGVQCAHLPADWVTYVRRIEELGFSSFLVPDHFGDQIDPVASLPAVAAVTTQLRVGALVYDVDYRHPVVYAKAAATTQLLSCGRYEFGIGAGWMQSDYDQAGMTYDRPGVRVDRMAEALHIVRSMWTEPTTTFTGEHYRVDGIARAVDLGELSPPKITIGGGGRRVLSLAGAHADIVGINPSLHEGRVTMQTALDLVPENVRTKVGWVRDAAVAAGRDPDALEYQSLVFVTAVTDDATPVRAGIATATGMTDDQVRGCPLFLIGSASELCESLAERRAATGINYVVIQDTAGLAGLEAFAEAVVAPLAGT